MTERQPHPSVVLSEAKDPIVASTISFVTPGDEILRFAQDDREVQ
jgi:hypothetical protein